MNQAFAKGVGKSVDEIVGHRIWDVFPGKEGDKRFAVVKHVFATGKSKNFKDRVAVVTGAASGIGRAMEADFLVLT